MSTSPASAANPPRQHAAGPGTGAPSLPEPSHAERARTLLSQSSVGSLSTHSRKQPGFPFGSLMPYALDGQGRPLLLISTMAMHTQNLVADPRAALLVTSPDTDGDPLGAARVTLLGETTPVPPEDLTEARELYLARHENSRYWVDFKDFAFFRMEVVDLYYVGGFGVMGWVPVDAFRQAAPDPLAKAGPGILAHMNADHADSLILLSRRFAGIEAEEAQMTAVDRLGFVVRLKTAEGMRGARINFLHEVHDSQRAREVLVAMVQVARQAREG